MKRRTSPPSSASGLRYGSSSVRSGLDQAVPTDDYLDHSFHHLSSAFDLHRDVSPVTHSVQHGVEAAVEEGKKNVQSALRLFDQVRPNFEFQRLAWTAPVPPL